MLLNEINSNSNFYGLPNASVCGPSKSGKKNQILKSNEYEIGKIIYYRFNYYYYCVYGSNITGTGKNKNCSCNLKP